jgi:diadenosine tetraphosphatase ApaH/serine/threonine PP2A family protein phosphatase
MIQALISDIHGNLAALKAVMADMEQSGAKRIICLGDVVGYGPYPGKCLDIVQSCGAVIMGNHEEALLYGAENFNPRARRAIDWTREHIKKDGGPEVVAQRDKVLKGLRIQAKSGNFLFTHASPRQPTREYVMPRDVRNVGKMQEIFSLIPHVCFVGHTHVPGIFLENLSFTRPSELFASTYFIDHGEKALINIGSVGQPRDGDIRACYVLLDDEPGNQRAVFRRVEYDVEETARAIEDNQHLDNHLAERLRHGR